eukprot:gb/GFBE01017306.1/.p1 GENE.gb/GFBE01017306.1/~~gb/GFBE01017306.1/.p1  ORF type:complete len:113 (+),score=21.34 gb/GFBE01017306.1/:1-339(+)
MTSVLEAEVIGHVIYTGSSLCLEENLTLEQVNLIPVTRQVASTAQLTRTRVQMVVMSVIGLIAFAVVSVLAWQMASSSRFGFGFQEEVRSMYNTSELFIDHFVLQLPEELLS